MRLEKLKRDPIAQIKLTDLKPIHFADWRDAQLCALAAGSVIREMQIMSVALNVARREWGWIDANPLSEVRKPPKAPARDRLVSRDEISKLLEVGLIVEENTPELFFGNPQH
ncbi:MAG: tyrosine-type recombinase/integrase, partial [Marinosulfonomonas sp.]